MAGCFGPSAEDRWKENMSLRDDDDRPVCEECREELDDDNDCENKSCPMYKDAMEE